MSEDLKAKIAEAARQVLIETCRGEINAAANAMPEIALQAIHDAGYAVVPLVPTEAMIAAVDDECTAWECFRDDGVRWEIADVWAAMITASQREGDGE